MNRLLKLCKNKNSATVFCETIQSLSHSQGFYQRLLDDINDCNEEQIKDIAETIDYFDFKDRLDVIIYLEC